ncbi:hypothetical protein PENSPDRAFT_69514 [Peniophora sp. CONT]|nr:hypothetical protein PENSPDRAFT_69514 [Peniophora sp. CONT]
MSTDPQSACLVQRLNLDCLSLIFYEDVLAEVPPDLYDSNLEWSEPRENLLREAIGVAQEYKGWALIRLSHVCRRWRTVALSLSSIWASLVAQFRIWYPNDGYETILKRSHGHPLSFVLPDYPLDSYMQTQLAENITRYNAIIFSTQSSKWSPLFSGNTASLLQRAVFITDEYWFYADDLDSLPSTNPLELAPIQMPVATHLAFDGLYMPFIAPQLTCLVITIQNACLSSSRIYDILQGTPLIESLTLLQYHYARGGGWRLDAVVEERVMLLPHLAYLNIWGSVGDVSSFLLRLDSPQDITLKISTYTMQNSAIFSQLADALRPYMKHPSHNHLTVSNCYRCQRGYNDPPIFSLSQGPDGPRRLAVHIDIDSWSQMMPIHPMAIERLVPGQIRSLTIEDWDFEVYPSFPSREANGAFHLDGLSQHVEELCYQACELTASMHYSLNNKRWGNGLVPDFLIRYPEKYPALRRIYTRGGSSHSEIPWPSAPQLSDMKGWYNLRTRKGISLEFLHLEGQLPEGTSTSLEFLGDDVPVVDNRHIKRPSPSPPSTPTVLSSPTSSNSSDELSDNSDEFYTHYAQHDASPY